MDPNVSGKKSIEEKLDIQFSQLSNESTNYQGFSSEALHLLVHTKKDRRLTKGKNNFNCYVIEVKKKKNNSFDFSFLKDLTKIDVTTTARIQLIVKNGGHFTAVDIQLSKDGNACLVLDAMGDMRGYMLAMNLLMLKNTEGQLFFKYVYIASPDDEVNVLQKDSFSCPIFAYDHVCQSSKLDTLFEYLLNNTENPNKNEQLINIYWIQMPPKLVWNSQSSQFIGIYITEHPEVENTFNPSRRFKKYISDESQSTHLATELLFFKYQKQYANYKERKQYPNLVKHIMAQDMTISTVISMREKLVFIVHAQNYWQQFSKKQFPKMLTAMQDAFSVEEFVSIAKKSSSFTTFFFKPSIKQQFCKAIVTQDELAIDQFYQNTLQHQ